MRISRCGVALAIEGAYPEATRLLFTGYADIRAVIEAINQGMLCYITKPWIRMSFRLNPRGLRAARPDRAAARADRFSLNEPTPSCARRTI